MRGHSAIALHDDYIRMKVVAYSIKNFEKEFLAKANQKKHDITLISNPLSLETAAYAEGKDAVVVFLNDDLSAPVIDRLADLGIKFITTRSSGTDHIDATAALRRNIQVSNIPAYASQAIAELTLTLALALSRKLIPTVDQSRNFDFTIENHIGFNLHGKTVGIIGLGHAGVATASIFKGIGCKVLGYDPSALTKTALLKRVSFETLLNESDIISLHIPLNSENHHFINRQIFELMKNGVMLLNTSCGGLIKTEDMAVALRSGKIGYLGLDVYENEQNLFFADHCHDAVKDPLLESLMHFPNVIITPHQAFLTHEALQDVASQTILNLDNWQKIKQNGKVCA